MATLAITIDLPPTGELEASGNGSAPTQAQQDEEMKARQNFIHLVSPYLESQVSVVGVVDSLQEWPARAGGQSPR